MIVDHIEVVSGASAVQGMGATGGIINTITRRPTQAGTQQSVELKLGTQLKDDSSGSWKTGYLLQHRSEATASSQPWDVIFYAGTQSQDTGVDGASRALATESLHRSADLFVKAGTDFGAQRLQLMVNGYNASGFDDRVDVPGDRKTGRPPPRPRARWPGTRRATVCARPAWNGPTTTWPAAAPACSCSSRTSRPATAAA
jgi:iron complex outermembrane receptor protein